MTTLRIGGNRTILDLFEDNLQQVPDRIFIRFSGRSYTYGEIGQESGRVADMLTQVGITHRSHVALCIGNRPAFLIALLGILRCGATVIPLNTQYKPDEVSYVLNHAACAAIITESALFQLVQQALTQAEPTVNLFSCGTDDEVSFVRIGEPGEGILANPPITKNSGPDDVAGIFYTSGTTARPKGVMITHENMMYSAEVTIQSLGLGENDVPALAFPLFHVNSLFYGVLTAIVLRGTIGLLRGFSVSRYWKDVMEVGATWTPGITGPLMRLLLRQEPSEHDEGHHMRFAVGGGFITLDEVVEFTRRFNVRVLPGWSMTETVSLGTLHPTRRLQAIPSTSAIGYPTLGQEVRVVDEAGLDVGPDVAGEVLFRSPSRFAGYLNDEEATREAFTSEGWFRTGDVARMDQSGYLSFMDRKKAMIKTKGENVAAAEVERVLNEHPGVLESAVVGIPDEEGTWGEKVEAFVVKSGSTDVNEEAMEVWARDRLADYKVPRAIHFVDSLPKTALGKIRHHVLRAERMKTLGVGTSGV